MTSPATLLGSFGVTAMGRRRQGKGTGGYIGSPNLYLTSSSFHHPAKRKGIASTLVHRTNAVGD